jgi:hypothetical protein
MLNRFASLRVVCNPFTAPRFIVIASELLHGAALRYPSTV